MKVTWRINFCQKENKSKSRMTYNQKTGNSNKSMGKDWPNKTTNQARHKKLKRIYISRKKFKRN